MKKLLTFSIALIALFLFNSVSAATPAPTDETVYSANLYVEPASAPAEFQCVDVVTINGNIYESGGTFTMKTNAEQTFTFQTTSVSCNFMEATLLKSDNSPDKTTTYTGFIESDGDRITISIDCYRNGVYETTYHWYGKPANS